MCALVRKVLDWISTQSIVIHGGHAVNLHLLANGKDPIYDLDTTRATIDGWAAEKFAEIITREYELQFKNEKTVLNEKRHFIDLYTDNMIIVHITLFDEENSIPKEVITHSDKKYNVSPISYTAAVYFALVNGSTHVANGQQLAKYYSRLIRLSELVDGKDVPKIHALSESLSELKFKLDEDVRIAGELAWALHTNGATLKPSDTLDLACFGNPSEFVSRLSDEQPEWVPSIKWDLLPGHYILHNVKLSDKTYKRINVLDCSTSSAYTHDKVLSLLAVAAWYPGELTLKVLYLLRQDESLVLGPNIIGRTISSSTMLRIEQESGIDRWDVATNIEFLRLAMPRLRSNI